MKIFRKLSAVVISAIVAINAVPAITSYAKSSSQLRKEKAQVERNISDMKTALEDVKAKQEVIAAEIIQLDIEVTQAQYELDVVTAELEEITAKLEESEEQLAQAILDRDAQEDTFKKRIRFIHENGYAGYLDILLESKNISDLFTRMQYINDIMEYDKETLVTLSETQQLIEIKTEEIAEERAQQEIVVEEHRQKKAELDDALARKQATAEQYERDEASYTQSISEMEAASKNIEKLIKEAEEAERIAAEKAAAEAARKKAAGQSSSSSSSSSSAGTYTYSGGALSWPVPGYTRLSSGYGYRNGVFVSGSEFHTGLDIPAPRGTNIVAAADGKVITAGYVRGYGNTIMISHGNGLVTLYGHNSSLAVSVGDWVSAGSVVAYCGSTGNSTGNHCHFEVRVNGSHTNPWNYL
ncbi:MAG: peptidoglycan DD-metalloendopeptidase family protein [Firmicutes bacterium]|nr:peptidoglycan DD-metalloendopeptidase family protein [Bacillota bacterium]